MHAANFFLMSAVELDVDDPKGNTALMRAAVSWFENSRVHQNLDDNNWYTVHILYTWDNRILIPDGHDEVARLRKEARERMRRADKDKIFSGIMNSALRAAAVDLGLHNSSSLALVHTAGNQKVDQATPEQLLQDILTEIPRRLAGMYSLMAGRVRPGGDGMVFPNPADNNLQVNQYNLRTLTQGFHAFLRSEVPPFTRAGDADPYHWRCYDLRDDGETIELPLILEVDIHT